MRKGLGITVKGTCGEAVVCVCDVLPVRVMCLFVSFFLFSPFFFFLSIYSAYISDFSCTLHVHVL